MLGKSGEDVRNKRAKTIPRRIVFGSEFKLLNRSVQILKNWNRVPVRVNTEQEKKKRPRNQRAITPLKPTYTFGSV
jgi:hypothetical protein